MCQTNSQKVLQNHYRVTNCKINYLATVFDGLIPNPKSQRHRWLFFEKCALAHPKKHRSGQAAASDLKHPCATPVPDASRSAHVGPSVSA